MTEHRFFQEFERGFSTNAAGAVRQCVCGRVFYNPNGGWDWDDGEVESLAASSNATALDWACGEVYFDGQTFAADCDCWHERGTKILVWLLAHSEQVAEFLTLVKAQKRADADRAPVVLNHPARADRRKPEMPPNRLHVLNLVCLFKGHRREWEPHHPGSSWEVNRCRRCGDTMGGTRKGSEPDGGGRGSGLGSEGGGEDHGVQFPAGQGHAGLADHRRGGG